MAFPSTPLALTAELQLSGVWTDITGYLYDRDPVNVTRGRADEASQLEQTGVRLTLNNRGGRFSPRNPTGPYYGALGRNVPLRLSVNQGATYLDLPGGDSDRVTAPDSAGTSITGDIDIRAEFTLAHWRRAQWLCGKWDYAADQRSWAFYMTRAGALGLSWSTNGFNELAVTSTAVVPAPAGRRQAVRATLDVDNGASGRTVTFYVAPAIAGPWTQLGAPVTAAGTTSVNDSTAVTTVGGWALVTGTSLVAPTGRCHAVQLLNGIGGTAAANPDFTAQTPGATSLADGAGNTWTVQGAATLTNRRPRAAVELAKLPQKWDTSGHDVYTPVEAAGVLRRLSQGAQALRSVMYRAVTLDTSTVAYWPMEDPAGSTTFVSGLPGGSPLAITADAPPEFAAFSGFVASAPLPTLSSSTSATAPVPPYNAVGGTTQLRFLLAVPAAGTTDGKELVSWWASGTARRWALIYDAAGALVLRAFNNAGTPVLTFAPAVTTNGRLLYISIELVQAGSDVFATLGRLQAGQTTAATGTALLTGHTAGLIERVIVAKDQFLAGVCIGHLSVHNAITPLDGLASPLAAYLGERAGRRIERLCAEEGVTFQATGDLDTSAPMGAQAQDTLPNLVYEAAETDLGVLFEPREVVGLGYRTRNTLYNQPPALALDYGDLADAFDPVDDDQQVKNDVTVQRRGGATSRATLDTGPMSTRSPRDGGIGRYAGSPVTINPASDTALPDQASWRLHLGTVNESRMPRLVLDLATRAFATSSPQTTRALELAEGDRITIANPPAWLPPEQITQMVQGYAESMRQYDHAISLNCAPESPWQVATYNSDRYSSDGSNLAAALTATDALVPVATPSGPRWYTGARSKLRCTGAAGARASTPDAAAWRITGDLDIRVRLAMDNWAPGASQYFVGKIGPGGQASYGFRMGAGNSLSLRWSTDGTTVNNVGSTLTTGFAAGTVHWVRATLDVDNGSSQTEIKFYTGLDGITWTQLGATATLAGVTTLFPGTVAPEVGGMGGGGGELLVGDVYYAEVRSGINGTVVAAPLFAGQAAAATAFTDAQGRAWTINSPAAIQAVDAEFPWDITIGGERMTVAMVEGTQPQTFGVTRSVNGVVKSHNPGAGVELFKPAIYAL
ncbi:hypothetical protein [Sphaerisporangium sp. NPDC051011]|uniref:hypothetical protein n=1 Tax=Sphaerisporangium sp. NPDC051011 TaxID=3155792 RepID=UPI0033EF6940